MATATAPRCRLPQHKIRRLAEDFEAAWRAEESVPEDYADEQMSAAVDHTGKFADRILNLPTSPDLAVIRLRARAYLWARSQTAAEIARTAETTDCKLLGALLLDLSADEPRGPSESIANLSDGGET